MLAFDGEPKLSHWPKEAKAYIKAHPKKEILYGQSKRSEHKFYRSRVLGRKLVVSYNYELDCFVAWSIHPNLDRDKEKDEVRFKLSTRCLNEYKSTPKFSNFYESISGRDKTVQFRKICVFPKEDFVDFYDNYEKYMEPDPKDKNYRAPAIPFSK